VKKPANNPHSKFFAFDLDQIVNQARDDFQSLRGARLFITGGTGYIGRWLLESICHANRRLNVGIRAVVLSRNPQKFSEIHSHLAENSCISFVQGEIENLPDNTTEFSHLIHAAADTNIIKRSNILKIFDAEILGARNIHEFALTHGIRNVLLLSSGAVYGRFPDHIRYMPESGSCAFDPTSAGAAYSLGKTVMEWLGTVYTSQYGLNCKIARIFAQIGPGMNLNARLAAGNFLRDALLGQQLTIRGNGSPLRSYMYATDLVVWLWAILTRGAAGTAYNVGSTQITSIRNLAETIAKNFNMPDSAIQILGEDAPGMAFECYAPDTTLASTALNLAVTVPLEDALQRTANWYRKNRAGNLT